MTTLVGLGPPPPSTDDRIDLLCYAYMLPTSLASFLVPLLNVLTNTNVPSTPPRPLQFQLRHVHAVSSSARVAFADVASNTDTESLLPYSGHSYDLTTRKVKTSRPLNFDAFSQARVRSMKFGQSESLDWEEDKVLAPDVEDRETLLALAKMANNAYVVPDEGSWYDLGINWTVVCILTISLGKELIFRSLIQLAGSPTMTALEDMSLRRLITRPLCYPSREHLPVFLAEEARP